MQEHQNIATRPDGSIDTAQYIARGRALRSQQAHAIARHTAARTPGALARLGLMLEGGAKRAVAFFF